MRVVAGVLLGLAVNQADASSFQTFDGKAPATPSIVQLDGETITSAADRKPTSIVATSDASLAEPAKAQSNVRPLSASVVAMGQPSPVSPEQVAAIGEDSNGKQRSGAGPIVVRGGIFGDAAPEPVALASPEAAKPKLSRPQLRKIARDIRRAVREGRMPPPGTAESAPAAATPSNDPAASQEPAAAQPQAAE